jgi:hypothetical protein
LFWQAYATEGRESSLLTEILAITGELRIVFARGGYRLGASVKKLAIVAALAVLASTAQVGWAASKKHTACYSQAAIEAEQAIRYMTDLMIISTACQNTTYAEFRLRNRDTIIAYQKAMIAHFRGAPAFDKWNTAIANVAAQKQVQVAPAVFCQQSQAMLKQASTLDAKAFRALAATQAAAAAAQYQKCGKH